jgi:hypothetical protein
LKTPLAASSAEDDNDDEEDGINSDNLYLTSNLTGKKNEEDRIYHDDSYPTSNLTRKKNEKDKIVLTAKIWFGQIPMLRRASILLRS